MRNNAFNLPAAYWSSWGSYGSCSKSCGSGTKTRSRSCHQGIGICSGSSSESASCNHGTCGKIMIAVLGNFDIYKTYDIQS